MPGFETLMTILIVVFVAGSIAASFVLTTRFNRKKVEKAKALAEALGLEFTDGKAAPDALPGEDGVDRTRVLRGKSSSLARIIMAKAGGFRVHGEYAGAGVAIWLETRSNGKSSSTWTLVRAYLAGPLRFSLRMSREGAMTKLGKALFGLKDLELGDDAFDPKVRVKTDDPVQAKLVLDHEARRAVLALLEAYPEAHVKSDAATWERVGLHLDPEKLRPLLEALAKVAATLGR
ncbi:MAG: hypothetical protein JXA15_14160 [Spirochaetales bacterium]|nr:hypothetical protein [Spirochaetales bacterium]